MGDDAQTFTPNQDGTFTISLDGKDTKLVKESDLLAVKGASETARTEYETNLAKHHTDLAEANRLKDEEHQQLLQERSAKELAETQATEGATFKTKVGELETKLTAAEDGRKQLEEELLGTKKSTLITFYHVKEDALKDKDLPQLRSMEDTLKIVGIPSGKPANYDGGGGGGTPTTPTTVLEGAKQELAVAREIQRKKRAGEDADYKP